jgi:hypothetical protein
MLGVRVHSSRPDRGHPLVIADRESHVHSCRSDPGVGHTRWGRPLSPTATTRTLQEDLI